MVCDGKLLEIEMTGNKPSEGTITIKNRKKVPSNAIYSWDVSVAKDSSVIAWYTDIDNNGLYELYIGGDDGVKANPDSSFLFKYFNNVTTIDVTYLNTSSVTSMSGMFTNCSSLTSLDLSSFDTSQVTNMDNMFRNCSKLATINLRRSTFGSVTTYIAMLSNSTNLTTITVKDADAKTFIEVRLADVSKTGVTVTIA